MESIEGCTPYKNTKLSRWKLKYKAYLNEQEFLRGFFLQALNLFSVKGPKSTYSRLAQIAKYESPDINTLTHLILHSTNDCYRFVHALTFIFKKLKKYLSSINN